MRTLNLHTLLELLNYSDIRAVRKWCKDNNVVVTKQGKNEFVFETNFKEAFELPFINNLKSKFGAQWEAVYQLYAEGNIPALNTLQEISSEKMQNYRPVKNEKNRFNEKLDNYVKNKAA